MYHFFLKIYHWKWLKSGWKCLESLFFTRFYQKCRKSSSRSRISMRNDFRGKTRLLCLSLLFFSISTNSSFFFFFFYAHEFCFCHRGRAFLLTLSTRLSCALSHFCLPHAFSSFILNTCVRAGPQERKKREERSAGPHSCPRLSHPLLFLLISQYLSLRSRAENEEEKERKEKGGRDRPAVFSSPHIQRLFPPFPFPSPYISIDSGGKE